MENKKLIIPQNSAPGDTLVTFSRKRRPTLYKHRGSWYARFWDSEEGKYHSRALGVTVEGKKERRKEAEQIAFNMLAAIENAKIPVKVNSANSISAMPLIEFAQNFWQPNSDYAEEKAYIEKKPLSKHYLLTNQRMVERRIKPFPGFADITLSELSKYLIHQWKLWLAKQGLSGRSMNIARQALSVPVKWAFGRDIIPTDPFAGVPRAPHQEKIRGILIPEEIKRLLETPIANPHSRLAVYFPLYCAMRMGEVRGLLWGDISDGIIHICHNWQEGEGLKKCKCGSEGFVPMPRIVADLVNMVYKEAPLTGLNDFVMADRPNKPICRETLSKALRQELSSIGITEEMRQGRNIVYHSLRHSFVTACRIAGLSDFETMTLSRHKDRKMLDRYSHGREALDVRLIGQKFENHFFLPT